MTTRIIRITECSQCPSFYCNSRRIGFCMKPDIPVECPTIGTPDWCPLEVLAEPMNFSAPPVDFIEFDLGENIPPIKVLQDCMGQPQLKVDIPLANPIEGE